MGRESRSAAILGVLLVAFLLVSLGEDKKADPSWSGITDRGRILAQYDVVAWHASDAVETLKPDRAIAPIYIARKVGDAWEVCFGRLNESRSSFLIAYRATQGTAPSNFLAKKVEPPSEDRGFYLTAAKAIEISSSDFGKPSRPYNVYAIPAANSEFYVYFLPAQTLEWIFPLGADVRYHVSADGNTVIDKRQMHKTVIEFDAKNLPKGATELEEGVHTHVLTDTPEDSDVFYVLTRKPSIPEMIANLKKHLVEIEPDGTIRDKGKL